MWESSCSDCIKKSSDARARLGRKRGVQVQHLLLKYHLALLLPNTEGHKVQRCMHGKSFTSAVHTSTLTLAEVYLNWQVFEDLKISTFIP